MHASSFFANGLENLGDRPCLVTPQGEQVSYAALATLADGMAAALAPGRQLVFIEGRNTVPSIAAYLGCLRAGHVVHVIDPERPDEYLELARTYRPHAMVRCSESAHEVVHLHQNHIDLHPDLVILLSTSGSTGSRKLVKLSYRNVQSNTTSIIQYLGLQASDRAVTTLKFHYSFGMSVINTHLAAGGSLVLSTQSLHEPGLLTLCRDWAVTNLSGVPYHFEMLDRMPAGLDTIGSLRLVTQAGGRLAPAIVRKYATLGRAQGWRFFVMYGQTEASPRMSYLPPDLAESNPDSIGIPIPGGSMHIRTDDGELHQTPGREGELVYSGPNVMMGYAHDWNDLATDAQLAQLLTGDLVVMDAQGLFRITGRKSRFVKPFGLRVSLDDVEAHLRALDHVVAVVPAGDERIAVFWRQPGTAMPDFAGVLAAKYGLPRFVFDALALADLPLLSNGKFDYRAMVAMATERKKPVARQAEARSPSKFIKIALQEFVGILAGKGGSWHSLEDLFAFYFPQAEFSPEDSFMSLGGDSLMYVEMSVALEDHLGHLPGDWYSKSLKELKGLSHE